MENLDRMEVTLQVLLDIDAGLFIHNILVDAQKIGSERTLMQVADGHYSHAPSYFVAIIDVWYISVKWTSLSKWDVVMMLSLS